MLKLRFGDNIQTPCALLLGGFDGIHKGHESLLERARQTRLPVGITTITGLKAGGDVFTLPERCSIFEREDLSFVLSMPYEEIRHFGASAFLRSLFSAVNAKSVFCGEDFRFGSGAAGSVQTLKEQAPCPVHALPIREENGSKVSISSVKQLLASGDLPAANKLLPCGYFVQGEVEHGRHTGRTYGFPTANVTFPEGKFLLREGVYLGETSAGGRRYRSIINFGARPTFGVTEKKVEAYLKDFQGDLYGQTVEIYPERFLRPIVKFSSVEELKNQLKKDLECL